MPEIPPQAVQAAATPAAVIAQYEHERFCRGRTPDDLSDAQDRKRHERDAGRLLAAFAEHGYRFWREVTPEEEQADTDAWPEPATTPQTAPESTETRQPALSREVGSADDPTTVETRTALRKRYADAIRAVLDKPNGWAYRGTLAYAVLAVRDDDLEDLRLELGLSEKRGDHYAEKARQAEAAVARVQGALARPVMCGPNAIPSVPVTAIERALDVPADGGQSPTPANEESDHG